MAMDKEKSDKSASFAKGGSTKMFGQQDASPSMAGTSSPANGRKGADNKYSVSGGNGKMAGQQGAHPAKSGGVAVSQPGAGKGGIDAGRGKMFGPQQAGPAKSGQSGK